MPDKVQCSNCRQLKDGSFVALSGNFVICRDCLRICNALMIEADLAELKKSRAASRRRKSKQETT